MFNESLVEETTQKFEFLKRSFYLIFNSISMTILFDFKMHKLNPKFGRIEVNAPESMSYYVYVTRVNQFKLYQLQMYVVHVISTLNKLTNVCVFVYTFVFCSLFLLPIRKVLTILAYCIV